jgi:hypothetical protein
MERDYYRIKPDGEKTFGGGFGSRRGNSNLLLHLQQKVAREKTSVREEIHPCTPDS